MNSLTAVVFDLGKVLLDFDYGRAAAALSSKGRLPPEGVIQFLMHTPVLYRYECGFLDRTEFYRAVCAGTGYRGTLPEFAQSFGDIFKPIKPMIDLQTALHERGVPTYIFSNTNELAIEFIRREYPFFSNFTGYVLSFEQGTMKPERKIYEAVEKTVGRKGAEILYVDDRPENIEAGRQMNWNVILHEQPESTVSKFRQFGLVQ